MLEQIRDLRAEGEELDALLGDLAPDDWWRPTPFKRWTPFDVVAHLHVTDKVAALAVASREAFRERNRTRPAFRTRLPREEAGTSDPVELRARWREALDALCTQLASVDANTRLPWFGPDMGVRMFATARQMETWAHAHDVYDLLQRRRPYHDRLRNVAVIGVRTFGWTFANRKLPVPDDIPYVRLLAPSGAIWEWNDPTAENRVEGTAVDFCHVVTQGRNVADTELVVRGETAQRWMAFAQCFAGGPVDPPAPRERAWDR